MAVNLDELTKSLEQDRRARAAERRLLLRHAGHNGFDWLGHYLRAGLVDQRLPQPTRVDAELRLPLDLLRPEPPRQSASASTQLQAAQARLRTGRGQGQRAAHRHPAAGPARPERRPSVDRRASRTSRRCEAALRAASSPSPDPRSRRSTTCWGVSPVSPRRGQAALTASPVLVGAVTVLVTIVAVFLSYNANSGLPFVPTYDLKANLPERGAAREGLRGPHRRRARGLHLEDRAEASARTAPPTRRSR